jgi:hypothetical protein
VTFRKRIRLSGDVVMQRARCVVALCAVLASAACAARGDVDNDSTTASAGAPDGARDYLVFVASEATDQIALLRFGPDGARIER